MIVKKLETLMEFANDYREFAASKGALPDPPDDMQEAMNRILWQTEGSLKELAEASRANNGVNGSQYLSVLVGIQITLNDAFELLEHNVEKVRNIQN